jgi:hypothetical protein
VSQMKTTRVIELGVALFPSVFFLVFLVYFFLGPYLLPTISPEQAGVLWQECELSSWKDSSTGLKARDCFGDFSFTPGYDDMLLPNTVLHSPFTFIYRPFRLNGQPIFVEKLGVKYYVNYQGRKMGPVFDNIYTDGCCENAAYAIVAEEGRYIFRGKRAGKYFLVMISVK